MFEKEANEYVNEEYDFCYYPEDNISTRINAEHDWQKGAEFGYNKAKEEWKKHFLQCSSPFCLDNFSEVKCYGELGNMAKKESE